MTKIIMQITQPALRCKKKSAQQDVLNKLVSSKENTTQEEEVNKQTHKEHKTAKINKTYKKCIPSKSYQCHNKQTLIHSYHYHH